ncbi:MAG: GerMN domain-containing protein [Sphaerochaetaceae bacterium]
MIDFEQQPLKEKKPQPSIKPLLIGAASFVIFCVALAIVFVPRIRKAVKDSGVAVLIHESEEKKEQAPAQARICFVSIGDSSISFREETVTLQKSSDTAHAVIEALLAGPSRSSGLHTMIPKGTKLIGITITDNYAFVDFSKKFSSAKDSAMIATQQVNQTLKRAFPGLEKIVILVEGKPQ